MNAITYRQLTGEMVTPEFLDGFDRYQEVKRCLVKDCDQWVLQDLAFIEDWNPERKREIAAELHNCLVQYGLAYGAYCGSLLVGFASLSPIRFGSRSQYMQMTMLQVSYEYRGRGIGKQLFRLICDAAAQAGAERLYLSTHTAEESQAFYHAMGCVDAQEINHTLADLEPYDRQMEAVLSQGKAMPDCL